MNITDYPEFDIVVCGAGCGGLAAALTAARRGQKVLLLEREGYAGGIITSVGLNYFDGIADAKSNAIVLRGIAKEFLVRLGICPADATHLDQINPLRAVYNHGTITIRNIEEFKVVADSMIAAEAPRLSVLYHTHICATEMEGDRIVSVLIANKNGLGRVRAKVFVDATGDADLVRFSSGKLERSDELMPMTLHFRVGNVRNSPNLKDSVRMATQAAHAAGEIKLFYGPSFAFSFAANEINVHAVRVPGDGSSAEDLTRAEIEGRQDAWRLFNIWKKQIPEFSEAYFVASGPNIGIRETWRIVGREQLSEKDILTNARHADGVATGTWYMDIHPNEVTIGGANKAPPQWPGLYEIRYGTLLPAGIANVLVAGRCHAATRAAASSSRVTCTAMDMGQAAGVASSLAVLKRRMPIEFSGIEVRQALDTAELGPVSSK